MIVYDGDRRIGKARLLDAVANGLARRKNKRNAIGHLSSLFTLHPSHIQTFP